MKINFNTAKTINKTCLVPKCEPSLKCFGAQVLIYSGIDKVAGAVLVRTLPVE